MKFRFEYVVTFVYILLGGIWITYSDAYLESLIHEKHTLTVMQTYKGWFYVLFTGLLLFFFLKKHLKKLRETERKAIESDRLKSSFLANISHEIRTPMNGILGFAELLKSPSLTGEEQRAYLNIIEQSSERMLLLINDLVAISRVETGEIKVNRCEINLKELLDNLLFIYGPIAAEKGLDIKITSFPATTNRIIYSDKEKILYIMSHLVKNAIQYTNRGYVHIGCQQSGEIIELYVKDSGIGISDENRDKIFNRFVREHNELAGEYHGVGLGLSIARSYAQIMGGDIKVFSKLDEGSEFVFYFPINY